MDQLHEELKEPLTESSGNSGDSGTEAGDGGTGARDGDRSPSEDDFLSCDSGSSSGEGGGDGRGAGEAELLIQDECGGMRVAPATTNTTSGGSTGGGISEKERLKERRVSGSPLRGASQEMDEDADVDTAAPRDATGEREAEETAAVSSSTPNQTQANTTTG